MSFEAIKRNSRLWRVAGGTVESGGPDDYSELLLPGEAHPLEQPKRIAAFYPDEHLVAVVARTTWTRYEALYMLYAVPFQGGFLDGTPDEPDAPFTWDSDVFQGALERHTRDFFADDLRLIAHAVEIGRLPQVAAPADWVGFARSANIGTPLMVGRLETALSGLSVANAPPSVNGVVAALGCGAFNPGLYLFPNSWSAEAPPRGNKLKEIYNAYRDLMRAGRLLRTHHELRDALLEQLALRHATLGAGSLVDYVSRGGESGREIIKIGFLGGVKVDTHEPETTPLSLLHLVTRHFSQMDGAAEFGKHK